MYCLTSSKHNTYGFVPTIVTHNGSSGNLVSKHQVMTKINHMSTSCIIMNFYQVKTCMRLWSVVKTSRQKSTKMLGYAYNVSSIILSVISSGKIYKPELTIIRKDKVFSLKHYMDIYSQCNLNTFN